MALVDKYKTADFAQVRVMGPRAGQNKAAVQGACHCFSLHWLSLIVSDPAAAAQSRMEELSKQAGGASPILQKAFCDRWGLEGASGADDMMCQIHGLITQDEFGYGTYNVSALTGPLFRSIGKGSIYSFWFAGGRIGAESGAHSVAFYANQMNTNVAIHFFDPNFGEFLFDSGEFIAFWDELTAMYGPMKAHMLRSVTPTKKLVLTGR